VQYPSGHPIAATTHKPPVPHSASDAQPAPATRATTHAPVTQCAVPVHAVPQLPQLVSSD
jgi:hypothetical protein